MHSYAQSFPNLPMQMPSPNVEILNTPPMPQRQNTNYSSFMVPQPTTLQMSPTREQIISRYPSTMPTEPKHHSRHQSEFGSQETLAHLIPLNISLPSNNAGYGTLGMEQQPTRSSQAPSQPREDRPRSSS